MELFGKRKASNDTDLYSYNMHISPEVTCVSLTIQYVSMLLFFCLLFFLSINGMCPLTCGVSTIYTITTRKKSLNNGNLIVSNCSLAGAFFRRLFSHCLLLLA